MTYTKTPQIGSISSGTHRPEDLIPAFCDALERLDEDAQYTALYHQADPDALEDEDAHELVNELQDALSELAPPYTYFGTHPGDGADFGFWPDLDRIEEDARAGELLKASDLSEIPADWIGPVALVNDHGNLTIGHTVASFREDWSCV